MSSISIETTNENQLTVEEYVRFIKIKDHVQQVIDSKDIKDALDSAERSLNRLTIELTVKYLIEKKK